MLTLQVSQQVHSLLRTEALTPQAVAHELDDFALLFSSRCFHDMGSNGAWAKAQVRYLRHCRTRPRGPKKSTRSTVRSEAGSQLCAGRSLPKPLRPKKGQWSSMALWQPTRQSSGSTNVGGKSRLAPLAPRGFGETDSGKQKTRAVAAQILLPSIC